MSGSAQNLAGLATAFQNLFLGTGKTESGSVTKTETGATTSSTRSDQNVIDQLQKLFDGALANSANPAAVQPVVDQILRQAQLAFAPQLAREAQSGLYNTKIRSQIADQAVADATGASSQAVLNYITQQQQIAGQTGNTLANAAKTTSGTTSNTQAAKSSGKANTAPGIGKNIGSIAGLGLAGYSLFKNKDAIFDKIGGLFDKGNVAIDNPDLLELVRLNGFMTPELAAAGEPLEGGADIVEGLLDLGAGEFNWNDALDFGGLSEAVDASYAALPDFADLFDFGGFEDIGGFDLTEIFGGGEGFLDDIWSVVGGIF